MENRRGFVVQALMCVVSFFVFWRKEEREPPSTDEQLRHHDHPAMRWVLVRDIHVGRLTERLMPGGQALVEAKNPRFMDWTPTTYNVHAGQLGVPSCGWPAGWPVAFTSVNNRFETVGW